MALAVCLTWCPAGVLADPPEYDITDLGTAGLDSYGRGVNDSGWVVGYADRCGLFCGCRRRRAACPPR